MKPAQKNGSNGKSYDHSATTEPTNGKKHIQVLRRITDQNNLWISKQKCWSSVEHNVDRHNADDQSAVTHVRTWSHRGPCGRTYLEALDHYSPSGPGTRTTWTACTCSSCQQSLRRCSRQLMAAVGWPPAQRRGTRRGSWCCKPHGIELPWQRARANRRWQQRL